MAADNTVKVNGLTQSATDGTNTTIYSDNAALVNATFADPGTVQITTGVAGTIGSIGQGASSNGSISQTVNGGTINLTQIATNAVSVVRSGGVGGDIEAQNLLGGTVTATATITGAGIVGGASGAGATIVNGVAGMIGAQGVGAATAASITSRVDSVTTSTPAPTSATPTVSTNNVTVEGVLIAGNVAGVSAGVQIGDPGTLGGANAVISTAIVNQGVGNSISSSGIGAQTGAGVTQSASNSTGADLTSMPANTVAVQNLNGVTSALSATNSGTIAADFNVTGAATVGNLGTGGVANSIGSQAVGGSSVVSVSSRFDSLSTSTPAPFDTGGGVTAAITPSTNSVIVAGDVLATNSGVVGSTVQIGVVGTALVDPITSAAKVSDGLGNSISATSIGASAGATVSQSASASTGTGMDLTTLPANSVSITGTNDVNATNNGGGTATATFGVTGNATVSDGVAGNIGGQAVGATGSASISSRFDTVVTVTPTAVGTGNDTPVSPSSNSVAVSGDVTTSNAAHVQTDVSIGSAASLPTPIISNANIADGVGNSISATAIGASSGAGVTQSASNSVGGSPMDLTTLPTNNVAVTGDVTASNDSTLNTVVANLVVTGDTTITAGIGGTIGAQGVGASSSASISSRFYNLENAVDAANSGPLSSNIVSATGLTTTNEAPINATVNLGDAASATTVAINGGLANTIGATAIGTSSGGSIAQSATSSGVTAGMQLTNLPTNAVNLDSISANNGVTGTTRGTVTATFNLIGTALSDVTISNGIANTIGAQAVGATSSASISSRFDAVKTATVDGAVLSTNNVTVNTGGLATDVAISATNFAKVNAVVNIDSTNGIAVPAAITGGVGNTIGAVGIGASAGASVTQSVTNDTGTAMDLRTLPSNTVTVVGIIEANNSSTALTNPVLATLNVNGDSSVSGGVGNSITSQAVGASASASISSRIDNADNANAVGTPASNAANLITNTTGAVTSTNAAVVTASANFGLAGSVSPTLVSIGGGIGNSIGASGIGASSIGSITQSVTNSTTTFSNLPTNTVNLASLTSSNTGSITAQVAMTGTNAIAATITGGLANSITAQAVGSASGASISQRISGVSTP